MSDSNKTIQIEIYGQKYTIRGGAKEEYVRKLALFLDRRMHEVAVASKVHNLSKIAILTALNLADELFQKDDKIQRKDGVLKNTERRMSDLIETLEGQFDDLEME